MSFLARIFRRFTNSTGFVGRDLQGNRFFEHPSVSDDPRRTKRVVKYAQGTDMLDYVAGHRRLAVQWTSWLTHTRQHPPTLDELEADIERQRRIMMNVAMIEAREREQAAQIAASEHATSRHILSPTGSSSQGNQDATVGTPSQATVGEDRQTRTNAPSMDPQLQTSTGQSKQPPSPWKPPPSDEPQGWQPRASIRRGG
ncbi:hypothetical protein C8Q80DRAFT_1203142 [Daedaleopsis nitida]|nr:hypothetical protein C8Q80DRAFT_1203142 [Daedaleopsis nitida]